jgi:hypothetical protein
MFQILKTIKKFKKAFFGGIIFLFIIFLLSRGHVYEKEELVYGVTFSQKQAIDLGLDWQETFIAILDDLGVKKMRLSAYWDEIESTRDRYAWEDIDWQISEASKREVEIILAVGGRLPRWPECHFPSWYEDLERDEKRKEVLDYIEATINRYKGNKNIINWQIENEPFLSQFGECPKLDKELFDAEIALVKKLDSRPVVITDSGEISIWVPAAKRANIFGTTMYRDTYSSKLKSYIHYPIDPGFFRFKKNIARLFAKPEKWMVIELQGEPWGPIPFQFMEKKERDRTMNLEKFKDMIEFSSKTGFREFYFWGVEWWYWEKETQNNNGLWEEAKKLY